MAPSNGEDGKVDPEPIREVIVVGPDGTRHTGTVMQYYHWMSGDAFVPGKYEKSVCQRLRLAGLPDGEQDKHNPDSFDVKGVGFFVVQH